MYTTFILSAIEDIRSSILLRVTEPMFAALAFLLIELQVIEIELMGDIVGKLHVRTLHIVLSI